MAVGFVNSGLMTLKQSIGIIMGANIGTCITAILSSFGANRNAKRVAVVHLMFNIIGTSILLVVLYIVKGLFAPVILDTAATHFGIAVSHSAFNVICTAILLPMSGILEKLAYIFVPETKTKEEITELDERLLATPAIALENSYNYAASMAKCAVSALKDSIYMLTDFKAAVAEEIREKESKTDHYEDIISDHLVKLSSQQLDEHTSLESTKLLKIIGDFERISDHAVNVLESAEELRDKEIVFSDTAKEELSILTSAVTEILDLSLDAFINNDVKAALGIEPLEEIIDKLKSKMRTHHILRLQHGECGIEAGFVWSDLLTNLERTSDHCSNIGGCIIESSFNNMNLHESLHIFKLESPEFKQKYSAYGEKYFLPKAK